MLAMLASSWPAPLLPLLGSAGSSAARRSHTSQPASARAGILQTHSVHSLTRCNHAYCSKCPSSNWKGTKAGQAWEAK
jgi:hypothetical protein